MSKRSKRKTQSDHAISWDRARAIFNDPEPPKHVWERQFDRFDDKLRKLASTPFDAIDFSDLWYYHHDLAYVELQPDLFAYLFPVCLMDWHRTLMQDEPCSHGDSEFHYGLLHGQVLQKMLTEEQRRAVFEFFRDSFLERLDSERGGVRSTGRTPPCGWIHRLNSLGTVMPGIDLLWEPWWSLDTPGRAFAALQYCSGLMYFEGMNPLLSQWKGWGGPYLWENDSLIHYAGWLQENVDVVASALTIEFVNEKVQAAVARLENEPEKELATRLKHDLAGCRELVELRISELPRLLRDPNADGWTV